MLSINMANLRCLTVIRQNAKTTDQKAALKKTSIKSPPLIYRAK